MPQLQLPVFPAGATDINRDGGVQCQDGVVVYIHGHLPVFQHEADSEVTSGQERVIWNPALSISAREFELVDAEVCRPRAAIATQSPRYRRDFAQGPDQHLWRGARRSGDMPPLRECAPRVEYSLTDFGQSSSDLVTASGVGLKPTKRLSRNK